MFNFLKKEIINYEQGNFKLSIFGLSYRRSKEISTKNR